MLKLSAIHFRLSGAFFAMHSTRSSFTMPSASVSQNFLCSSAESSVTPAISFCHCVPLACTAPSASAVVPPHAAAFSSTSTFSAPFSSAEYAAVRPDPPPPHTITSYSPSHFSGKPEAAEPEASLPPPAGEQPAKPAAAKPATPAMPARKLRRDMPCSVIALMTSSSSLTRPLRLVDALRALGRFP